MKFSEKLWGTGRASDPPRGRHQHHQKTPVPNTGQTPPRGKCHPGGRVNRNRTPTLTTGVRHHKNRTKRGRD